MKQKEHIVSLKKRIEKSPKYKLNPPLSEETISELEHRFQFRLPEEYRLFLILAGNGGQLPSITHDCDEFLPFPTDIINQRKSLEKLRQPFAFQDSCILEEGSDDWKEAFRENGAVRLAEDETDSQITWLLIVTGEYHGEIWFRGEAGIWRARNLSFLEWLELALSKKLGKIASKSVKQCQKEREVVQPDLFTKVRQKKEKMEQRGFRWNPPISLDEVRTFEQKHGVTLPKEYVQFITEIADGGRDEALHLHSLNDFDHMEGLSDPFPFQSQEDCDRIPFKQYSSPIERGLWEDWSLYFPSIKLPEQEDRIWYKKEYSVLRGALPITTKKNNPPPRRAEYIQYILILNGDFRGKVWGLISHRIIINGPANFFSYILHM